MSGLDKASYRKLDTLLADYMITTVKSGSTKSFLQVGNNWKTSTIMSLYFKRFGLQNLSLFHSLEHVPVPVENMWKELNITINTMNTLNSFTSSTSINNNNSSSGGGSSSNSSSGGSGSGSETYHYDSVFIDSRCDYNYNLWRISNGIHEYHKQQKHERYEFKYHLYGDQSIAIAYVSI